MKKLFFIALSLFCAICVYAESKPVLSNGIWYMIDSESRTAVVIPKPEIKGVNITVKNQKKVKKMLIPSSMIYYPSPLESNYIECEVIGIGAEAFADNAQLEEVIIPSTATFIGEKAFAGCQSLKCVSIPASVVEIGDYAFANCKKLRHVRFANSLGAIAGQTNWFVGSKVNIESVLMPGESVSIY